MNSWDKKIKTFLLKQNNCTQIVCIQFSRSHHIMTKNKPICNQSCMHIFKTAINLKWSDFRIPQKRSAALKHTLKGVFKKAKFESTQSVAVLTQELRPESSPVISNKIIGIVKRSSQIIIIIILSNVVICIRI